MVWSNEHVLFQNLSMSSSPQVRDEVHKKIAELTAWSMECAGHGAWPQTGFAGEEFHPKTIRFKRKGSELANGWRSLAILFQFRFSKGGSTVNSGDNLVYLYCTGVKRPMFIVKQYAIILLFGN